MRCSIAIATREKAEYLDRTLQSIRCQDIQVPHEIIVVNDNVHEQATAHVCAKWDVERYITTGNPTYRNPAAARNLAYKVSTGDIIIAQSDEVMHKSPKAVDDLCNRLHENQFIVAQVYNYSVESGKLLQRYTGTRCQRPFFFLGSLWREDLYAVGGCDEDFIEPGFDDNWFADCLIAGLGLTAVYEDTIIGLHQDHPRPTNLASRVRHSNILYHEKVQRGVYKASGGPWEC